MGKKQEALKDLNQAIRILPTYGNALLNRGRLKIQLNDTTGACLDFEQAALFGKKKGVALQQMYCK